MVRGMCPSWLKYIKTTTTVQRLTAVDHHSCEYRWEQYANVSLMVNCHNIDFDGAARETKFTVMQRKEKSTKKARKNEVRATCCETVFVRYERAVHV